MTPHNLNWEQINPDSQSDYLHSRHIVCFIQEEGLQNGLESQGQF